MSYTQINIINSYEVDIEKVSPGIKQYLEIRRKHPHVIILYRMGDFYETFFEDAIKISKELGITLTSRDAGSIGRIPLAGVPAKAIDMYMAKLLERGHKVAICEQLEDPKQAKGIVKRDVVKTITPGTKTDDNLINSNSNNFLAAIWEDKNKKLFGLAYTDITTGEFKVTEINFNQLLSELSRILPSEILVVGIRQKIKAFEVVPDEIPDVCDEILNSYNISTVPKSAFDVNYVLDNLDSLFKNSTIDKRQIEACPLGFNCAGAIIYYLIETQKTNLPLFDIIMQYHLEDFVIMDLNTRKNLEIAQTIRENKKQGSLLWAIDKTVTNMGARLLRKWVSQPLTDIKKIEKRQSAVAELFSNPKAREGLKGIMDKTYDVERLTMKIANNTANPKNYIALKNSLSLVDKYVEILSQFRSPYLNCIENANDLIEFACSIESTINEDAPINVKDGNVIKENVNLQLDHLKSLESGAKKWLEDYEAQERVKTGIKNLKVTSNRNTGYYIEITSSFLSSVPATYIRRQTLKGSERFITEELRKHENEVFSAEAKALNLESEIFNEFREFSRKYVDILFDFARKIAKLDVLVALAQIAVENDYVCPKIVEDETFKIISGRHPVIEKLLPMNSYVSNDFDLIKGKKENESARCMILTGPNMAGKSTFMRQNALIAILAQIGSYVPATSATIGIVDKIFTRVGAVDDLAVGQSTFMVEMSETAHILNNASSKSLILLDEIGRGTSTYDGVAIAWSVAWYISQKIKARTIFATHYHELNVLANLYPEVKNYLVTVSEENNDIVFLRKVIEGHTNTSYGIHVAKMAGLPTCVVDFASEIMQKLQKNYMIDLEKNKSILKKTSQDSGQLALNLNSNK